MRKRTICVVTGTRADYGLLSGLMEQIQLDPDLTLQIIATGMHLSHEFGLTYKAIEQDGFHIDEKVEMLLSSDTPSAISKSVGLAIIGLADALERLKPNILVILGDRTEALAAAQAALIARIPIAHIHGGEISEGATDDAIRHSITKMSHLHFVAAEPYRKRVIQLGEQPGYVFNYGALGVENSKRIPLKTKEQLEQDLGFSFGPRTFLITYHPVTLKANHTKWSIEQLLSALDHFTEDVFIFTKPNSDTDGRIIIEELEKYQAKYPNRVRLYSSLGQVNYLSMVQACDLVLGNSSSGLIEVPSFHKATVNIGDRQKGRLKADTIIDCEDHTESIVAAIQKAMSEDFQTRLPELKSPYECTGRPSILIKEKLKEADLSKIVFKKFYDHHNE